MGDRGQRGKQRRIGDRQVDREGRGQRGKQRQVGDTGDRGRNRDRWERGTLRNTEKCFKQTGGRGGADNGRNRDGWETASERDRETLQTDREDRVGNR